MTNILADLARMTTATTGTGTITLGSAVGGYLSFAGAGIADGQVVSYGIVDGVARETGKGTYTSSGTTLSRTVYKSTNSNNAISLSGNAEVFITANAEDIQDIFLMPTFNGVIVPTAAYKHGLTSALALGDTDFYTCPAGKRAILLAARISGTPAAGSVTAFLELHVASTFYRITTNNTVTTAQNFNFSVNAIILEATDKLAVNIATSTGSSLFWAVVEFDALSTPIFTKRILGPSTGDNTLYTCPAGKSAMVLNQQGAPGISQGSMSLLSDNAARTWKGFAVPNGGASGTANQLFPNASVNNTINTQNIIAMLTAGDFIVVNVDTGNAAQLAWINVLESPNV